jgi:putative ABC transport system ATP-binding protein
MVPLIAVDDLVKTYGEGPARVQALRRVTLRIERGEFVALTGASGCGKSTFLHVLGCLAKPTAGRYLFSGRDITTLSADELARIRNHDIGFVFQGFHLLPRMSALENVELPLLYGAPMSAAERRVRATEELTAVGLADRLLHEPSQMSGGQQQRVAIARALVNRPSLLLADEPTGNLDTRTSLEIIEIFQRLNTEAGLTLVLVTHEHEIALYARRLFSFRAGRLVADRPIAPPRVAEVDLRALPAEALERSA